jgi:hypothetical protein
MQRGLNWCLDPARVKFVRRLDKGSLPAGSRFLMVPGSDNPPNEIEQGPHRYKSMWERSSAVNAPLPGGRQIRKESCLSC